jgi:hypothetical protein
MNITPQSAGQSIGLDVGTSHIVVARNGDKTQQFAAQSNAFVCLPNSPLARTLLAEQKVFHEVVGPEIIVAGDDAGKFADLFRAGIRRPMLHGVLNPDEPHSLTVLRMLLAKLLGTAPKPGQKLVFSVPAPVGDDEEDITYHETSVRKILEALGYSATSIPEGLAVVLAELASSDYTGIAISFGGGLCNACLAVLSLPVISLSVPKAGDFIDERAAKAVGEAVVHTRTFKEQAFEFNGFTGERMQNALTVFHESVMRGVVDALAAAFARRLPKLDQPIPLVLSGGTALPKGFEECFARVLHSCELPFQVSEIRLAPDPLHSTARGAMLAAHL